MRTSNKKEILFYLQARVEALAGKYLKDGCDFPNTSASWWRGLLKKPIFLARMFKKPSRTFFLNVLWLESYGEAPLGHSTQKLPVTFLFLNGRFQLQVAPITHG
jgi:hypothetical protein